MLITQGASLDLANSKIAKEPTISGRTGTNEYETEANTSAHGRGGGGEAAATNSIWFEDCRCPSQVQCPLVFLAFGTTIKKIKKRFTTHTPLATPNIVVPCSTSSSSAAPAIPPPSTAARTQPFSLSITGTSSSMRKRTRETRKSPIASPSSVRSSLDGQQCRTRRTRLECEPSASPN